MKKLIKLKEIASYAKGSQINGDDLVENGVYEYLNGGINPSGKWNDFNTPGGTVTISEGGNSCGYVNYMENPFWCGAHCYYLYDTIQNTRYLYYALKSQQNRLMRIRTGACMPNIKKADLGAFELYFETDEKQQANIVSILEKAESIILIRQHELQKLDDLVKARFVEMFGDSFGNPKGWRRVTFKEAGERLSDGPFGSNLKSEHYTDNGVRVIRLGNIGAGRFIDDDKSFISVEHYERLKKYTCKAGEIVIGTLGDPNLRACIVPEEVGFAINKADCVHFIPKGEILNNTFVCQFINCPETLLLAEGMIHGQTRSRISSGQIAQMPIFVPPMRLQNEYAEFVNQVDKSKAVIQKSLDEAQLLFDSLMQQYFG